MLRDTIRQLSNGIEKLRLKGSNVGVVDERGEIASVYHGMPGLDIGERTDVLSNCPKYQGIEMIVRSMGVQIIATDEIGTNNDCKAINEAALSGVNLVFTMHGNDIADVTRRGEISRLVQNGIFDNVVLLSNKNGPRKYWCYF